MLREYYSSIYTNTEKHDATSTTSKYYKFKDGNVFVEIRNGDLATRIMPCNYLAAVNLYELTGKGRSVQEAFQLAKNYIDKTVKLFK